MQNSSSQQKSQSLLRNSQATNSQRHSILQKQTSATFDATKVQNDYRSQSAQKSHSKHVQFKLPNQKEDSHSLNVQDFNSQSCFEDDDKVQLQSKSEKTQRNGEDSKQTHRSQGHVESSSQQSSKKRTFADVVLEWKEVEHLNKLPVQSQESISEQKFTGSKSKSLIGQTNQIQQTQINFEGAAATNLSQSNQSGNKRLKRSSTVAKANSKKPESQEKSLSVIEERSFETDDKKLDSILSFESQVNISVDSFKTPQFGNLQDQPTLKMMQTQKLQFFENIFVSDIKQDNRNEGSISDIKSEQPKQATSSCVIEDSSKEEVQQSRISESKSKIFAYVACDKSDTLQHDNQSNFLICEKKKPEVLDTLKQEFTESLNLEAPKKYILLDVNYNDWKKQEGSILIPDSFENDPDDSKDENLASSINQSSFASDKQLEINEEFINQSVQKFFEKMLNSS
eukprot:403369517